MLDPPQRINLVLQLTFKIVLTICSRTIGHLIELQTLFSLATYMCPFEQSKNRNPKGPACAGPFCLFVDFYGPTVVAQVDVCGDLIGVDDHLFDLLASFVEVRPGISTLPDFHG